MENLESISKSIQSKRNEKLDSQKFPLSQLQLSSYDIRKNRGRNQKLKEDLARDGQLQAITVSKNGDVYTTVNGRTRQLEMMELNETSDLFDTVKVEVYENLTELEQNYLNAQINISQNPLTPDEKIEFVIKYKDILNPQDLAKALGLDMKMLDNYLAVATTSPEVREAFTPKNEGYGRSGTKVEELGKIVRKGEQLGVEFTTEDLICMGEKSEVSQLTRDEKRKQVIRLAEKYAKFKKNEKLTEKYTPKELINFAEKESTITGSSGDKLPLNSSEKYNIVDGLLKNTFEFAVLLFSEGLYRIDDDDNKVESETKRIIDNVDELIVVGNEIEKLSEIEDYALSLGKKITIYNEDVIEKCDTLKVDNRIGFIYVNGASLYSQRPEFMNYLKKKYSSSTIAVVVIDLLFGKSNVYQCDRLKERITVFSGAENFEEVIVEYRKRVKSLRIRRYAETPQEKYIFYI